MDAGHAAVVGLVRHLVEENLVPIDATYDGGMQAHLSFDPEELDGEFTYWTDTEDGRLHIKVVFS